MIGSGVLSGVPWKEIISLQFSKKDHFKANMIRLLYDAQIFFQYFITFFNNYSNVHMGI